MQLGVYDMDKGDMHKHEWDVITQQLQSWGSECGLFR